MEKRIIVIEDDPLYRRLIKEYLKESKFIIDHAAYASEAIKKIEKEKYDLIISDLRLPDSSGKKIVEHVSRNSNTIPMIIMTAYPDIEEAIDLMKLGIFDYLTKPIDKIKLLLTVEKAFAVKDLVKQKRELELKVSEFDMRLEYLVMERTKKLSSDYKRLKDINLDSIKILSETIESKDPFTRGHCLRVSKYSLEIAKELGFSRNQLEMLEIGALLHDIGKIGVRGAILNKNGRLTKREWAHVMRHPVIGESILERIDFFKKIMPIIRNHHEKYDGTGYPDGLRAHNIPIESRIVCVVDAYDAMISDRPYRKGMSENEAIERLKRASGIQFDPRIVELFIQNQIYLGNENNIIVEDFNKIKVCKKF